MDHMEVIRCSIHVSHRILEESIALDHLPVP